MVFKYFLVGWAEGWLEKWGLKLTSAKVEVEVEAELGKNATRLGLKSQDLSPYFKTKMRVLVVIFMMYFSTRKINS